MQGKENQPKREKNTMISFPLINPDPITVPIMAKKAETLFFIIIFYYHFMKNRIKQKKAEDKGEKNVSI